MPKLPSLDKMDLEELENDIAEAISDIWLILHGPTRVPTSWQTKLERMRYKLASYTENPLCCACGESPARQVEDGYYCERCVKKE